MNNQKNRCDQYFASNLQETKKREKVRSDKPVSSSKFLSMEGL